MRPEPMTTLCLALAAVVAGGMSLFGESDSFSMLTVVCALAGLLPWALVVGGVELRSWQFFLLSVPFGAVIVVIDDNPGRHVPADARNRVAGPDVRVVEVAGRRHSRVARLAGRVHDRERV